MQPSREGSPSHGGDVAPRVWATRRGTIIRLVRYSAVSLVATTTSLMTLGLLVGVLGVPAIWSNVIATAVGTVPSFELNRRWVWNDAARRSLFGQILPFCALSFTGLVLSTVAVGVAADQTSGWSHWGHTVAVLGANVAAYGTLWVVQYQLLDRVLFRHGADEPAGRASSAGPEAGQVAPCSDGPDEGSRHVGSSLPLVSTRGEHNWPTEVRGPITLVDTYVSSD
jgi:putative flippase GtrA